MPKLVHIVFPDDLKTVIHNAARAKGNSFSSEVRERLYSTFTRSNDK